MNIRSAVIGTTALIVLLSAGATQALSGSDTVYSDDIVNWTITNDDVKGNSLTGAKIADGTIAGADVLNGTIAWADLAQDSVTTTKVENDSLTGVDINESTLAIPKVFKAQVNADGTLRTGSSGVTSQRATETGPVPLEGFYNVHFPVNVSLCAATGSSAGFPGQNVTYSVIVATEVTNANKDHTPVGLTSVSPIQTPNDVWVSTYDTAENDFRANRAFALTVVC